MSFLFRTLAVLACFTLLSCNSINHRLPNLNKPNACQQICLKNLEFCRQSCDNNCRLCSTGVTNEARKDCLQYEHEVKIRGGYITRGLNSYRDPLKCRKVTCNCAADFDTCNQGCKGIIRKKIQPVPYCS